MRILVILNLVMEQIRHHTWVSGLAMQDTERGSDFWQDLKVHPLLLHKFIHANMSTFDNASFCFGHPYK